MNFDLSFFFITDQIITKCILHITIIMSNENNHGTNVSQLQKFSIIVRVVIHLTVLIQTKTITYIHYQGVIRLLNDILMGNSVTMRNNHITITNIHLVTMGILYLPTGIQSTRLWQENVVSRQYHSQGQQKFDVLN